MQPMLGQHRADPWAGAAAAHAGRRESSAGSSPQRLARDTARKESRAQALSNCGERVPSQKGDPGRQRAQPQGARRVRGSVREIDRGGDQADRQPRGREPRNHGAGHQGGHRQGADGDRRRRRRHLVVGGRPFPWREDSVRDPSARHRQQFRQDARASRWTSTARSRSSPMAGANGSTLAASTAIISPMPRRWACRR